MYQLEKKTNNLTRQYINNSLSLQAAAGVRGRGGDADPGSER